jgi:hypothetical protein
VDGDEKLSEHDLSNFKKKYPSIELGWIENLIHEREIDLYHEFKVVLSSSKISKPTTKFAMLVVPI